MKTVHKLPKKAGLIGSIVALVQGALLSPSAAGYLQSMTRNLETFDSLVHAFLHVSPPTPDPDADLRLLAEVRARFGGAREDWVEQAMNLHDLGLRRAMQVSAAGAAKDAARDAQELAAFNYAATAYTWNIFALGRMIDRPGTRPEVEQAVFELLVASGQEMALAALNALRLRQGDDEDDDEDDEG